MSKKQLSLHITIDEESAAALQKYSYINASGLFRKALKELVAWIEEKEEVEENA